MKIIVASGVLGLSCDGHGLGKGVGLLQNTFRQRYRGDLQPSTQSKSGCEASGH